MGSRAVALCGLFACYAPQVTPGLPCAPPGTAPRCPDGLVCIVREGAEVCEADDLVPGADARADAPADARADAAVDGSIGVDTDGDGVVDAEDNCLGYPNPDQDDEDADGAGDVCDPCPPFGDNSDPDGDDVGGPCDPDPMVAGNAIVAFAGFSSGLPSGWTAVGAIDTSGGDAVFGSSATEAVLVTPAPMTARLVVSALVTPASFTTTLGGIGVIQRRSGTETGIACQLVSTSTGTPQALRGYDLYAGATLVEGSHAVAIDTAYQLSIARDGNEITCAATAPALSMITTAANGATALDVGVRARNAGARYAWILVVRRP